MIRFNGEKVRFSDLMNSVRKKKIKKKEQKEKRLGHRLSR